MSERLLIDPVQVRSWVRWVFFDEWDFLRVGWFVGGFVGGIASVILLVGWLSSRGPHVPVTITAYPPNSQPFTLNCERLSAGTCYSKGQRIRIGRIPHVVIEGDRE